MKWAGAFVSLGGHIWDVWWDSTTPKSGFGPSTVAHLKHQTTYDTARKQRHFFFRLFILFPLLKGENKGWGSVKSVFLLVFSVHVEPSILRESHSWSMEKSIHPPVRTWTVQTFLTCEFEGYNTIQDIMRENKTKQKTKTGKFFSHKLREELQWPRTQSGSRCGLLSVPVRSRYDVVDILHLVNVQQTNQKKKQQKKTQPACWRLKQCSVFWRFVSGIATRFSQKVMNKWFKFVWNDPKLAFSANFWIQLELSVLETGQWRVVGGRSCPQILWKPGFT